MKDRIKQIMDSQQMSQQSFAAFLDISPATLSSIFTGRTKPTLSTVEAIKMKIPNINTDWLMFGSGNMYSDSKDHNLDTASPTPGGETGMLDFGFDDSANVAEDLKTDTTRATENNSVRNTPRETVKTEVKYVDRPQRHVVEIKVYYDDFTYESFYPAPKK